MDLGDNELTLTPIPGRVAKLIWKLPLMGSVFVKMNTFQSYLA